MGNNVGKFNKTDTKEKYIDPFAKVLVSNLFRRFYHVLIMKGKENFRYPMIRMWG